MKRPDPKLKRKAPKSKLQAGKPKRQAANPKLRATKPKSKASTPKPVAENSKQQAANPKQRAAKPRRQPPKSLRHAPKRHLPQHIRFAIVARFLQLAAEDGESSTVIAVIEWCRKQAWYDPERHVITKPLIYRLVREAIHEGDLIFRPPHARGLENDFKALFGLTGLVSVIHQPPETVAPHLATAAASLVVDLIHNVYADKQAVSENGADTRVHLGFGAGGAARRVAQALARDLRSLSAFPPLTLHALTSGFDVKRTLDAPATFFSYFEDLNPSVESVGLYSAPVVDCDEWEATLRAHGVQEARDEAHHIDIVITSLARGADPHGLLTVFLQMYETARTSLRRQGHVGDVLMQPYSDEGPLPLKHGIRAVTLFDLPELVKLAQTPGKHVVLVTGPCEVCHAHKAEALLPLLTVPSLRVCNHLVTDIATAEAVLQ